MVHGSLTVGTKFQKKVACNCQAKISAKVSQEVSSNLQLSAPFPVRKSWEELLHITDTQMVCSVESIHFLVIGGNFFRC